MVTQNVAVSVGAALWIALLYTLLELRYYNYYYCYYCVLSPCSLFFIYSYIMGFLWPRCRATSPSCKWSECAHRCTLVVCHCRCLCLNISFFFFIIIFYLIIIISIWPFESVFCFFFFGYFLFCFLKIISLCSAFGQWCVICNVIFVRILWLHYTQPNILHQHSTCCHSSDIFDAHHLTKRIHNCSHSNINIRNMQDPVWSFVSLRLHWNRDNLR